MQILMLCANALPDAHAPRGGPVYYWQNLQALVQLGHKVHLRVIGTGSPVPTELISMVESFAFIPLSKPNFITDAIRTFPPTLRKYNLIAPGYFNLKNTILTHVDSINPDLIWADWIGSLVATYEVRGVPVIYSLHDFAHNIERVKRGLRPLRISSRALVPIRYLRETEYEIIQTASAVASASATEADIVRRDTGVYSEYIPICGNYVSTIPSDTKGREVRYFIFGNDNTAMKASRHELQHNLFSFEEIQQLNWHHVGHTYPKEKEKWLRAASGIDIIFHGYVKNLGEVFRAEDALITPYAEGTGFRTKFVTAAAYGVVNIAYERNYHCAPEFVNNENCLSAYNYFEMIEMIRKYDSDGKLRRRLSIGARAVYENYFHLDYHMPKYERLLWVAKDRYNL